MAPGKTKPRFTRGFVTYVCRSASDYFLGAFTDFFAAGFAAAFADTFAAFFGGATFLPAMAPVFFRAFAAAGLPFTIGSSQQTTRVSAHPQISSTVTTRPHTEQLKESPCFVFAMSFPPYVGFHRS
jgi:hypothetical protein